MILSSLGFRPHQAGSGTSVTVCAVRSNAPTFQALPVTGMRPTQLLEALRGGVQGGRQQRVEQGLPVGVRRTEGDPYLVVVGARSTVPICS